MSRYPIREFYSNGKIKYEYLRDNGDIKDLRCWDEEGQPIPERYIKYDEEDTDAEIAIKMKYICKKMPVPKNQNSAQANMPDKKSTFYKGVDY